METHTAEVVEEEVRLQGQAHAAFATARRAEQTHATWRAVLKDCGKHGRTLRNTGVELPPERLRPNLHCG